MKDSIFPFGFKLMIHTCQMLSNAPGNDHSLKEANNKPYIIKPRVRLVINGHLFPLNVNKVYDVEIDNLEDFLVLIDIVREDLNVTKWVFNRVDFTFDTKLKYNDIFKYNLIHYLLTIRCYRNKKRNRYPGRKYQRKASLNTKKFIL